MLNEQERPNGITQLENGETPHRGDFIIENDPVANRVDEGARVMAVNQNDKGVLILESYGGYQPPMKEMRQAKADHDRLEAKLHGDIPLFDKKDKEDHKEHKDHKEHHLFHHDKKD